MNHFDWYKCRFLESSENLKPLVQKRFGREPSTAIAREIAACLQQGRLFYEAAAHSPVEIRPLQMFYGMVGFAKAVIVAHGLRSLSTLRRGHGVRDVSPNNCRIADLRAHIDQNGTFHEFNNVVASLTRLSYPDPQIGSATVPVPSATSEQISGQELSLQQILARIPDLETPYR